MSRIISTVFVLVLGSGISLGQDYYWRPYTGIIPNDALIGTDDGLVQTYIGSVYVHGVGMLVGQLFGGFTNITVTGGVEHLFSVYHRDENIQILCTRNPEHYQWITTNRTDLINQKYDFVIGGQQAEAEGDLYIGRIDYEGVRIGKVDAYFAQLIDIFFVYKGEELSTINLNDRSYEVLIYKNDRAKSGEKAEQPPLKLKPPAIIYV